MKVQVTINNVKIIKETGLNENEYNIHEFEFEFVEEYEGLTKKAVFTDANEQSYIETIVNNKCSVPTEVLHKNEYVTIGVYAYEVENEELKLRYSPQPTHFFVNEGSYKSVNNSTPPTPSEIEQLQSQITQNSNDIDVLEGNILNLQEEQVAQNRNIQANADDIEEIQQEQITQNTNIQKNTDDIVNINQAIDTINTDITNIDSAIGNINEDIDNLEQDLTNYSLITETGSQINLNINSTNYQITAILKDKNGNVIYTSNAIDLPIESMIVNARYDNTTKEIVLTLQNGNTLRISVADLISGLVSETQLQTILANYYTKTEVDNLLSEKANQTSLDTTNQNLTNLAGRVSTNEEDIADIKEEQTTQNANIEELQNQVETLQEDLESANAEIEELNTDITNMAKAMYKVDGQGTDITLENTSENKFVEFGLEGRTEQESLSGKNLLDGANPTKNNSAIVSMTNNTIKVSSTAINTTPSVIYEIDNVQQGDTYRINAIIKNSNGQIVLQTKQDDTWTTYVILPYINGTSITSYSYVIGTNVEAIRYLLYADKSIPTGASESNYENVIVTKNNADMTYEPYCGGIPSPNSDYPQQIKNVTGNANVKIQNKNLFDGEIELGSINPANGELQPNTARTRSKNFLKVKPNTTYTMSVQTGQFRWIIGYTADKIGITDGNISGQASAISAFPASTEKTNTFTTTATTEYIKWYDTTSTDLTEKVQIEEGSTATSYVEHQEQNYPFTFAEGQRGMQGTQPKDDGIHNKRIQIVFDGSSDEQWGTVGSYLGKNRIRLIIPNAKTYPTNENHGQLCSHFNYGIGAVSGTTLYVGNFAQSSNSTNFYFLIEQTTKEEFLTWLSSNPIMIEIELAESELENNIIPYNATQQAQYNAIKQARSYDDITYITSESDELGFDMKVVAVADANKVIESQNNEIDTIKSRLDLLEG